MDKQKQIEEMAKVIFERGVALECIDFIHGLKGSDHFYRIATALYNAGYRKIPDGAVVIPKTITEDTDSETLLAIANYNERVRKVERKETAEKFAERLKEISYQAWIEEAGESRYELIVGFDDIDEIAKAITEGDDG